MARRPPRPGPVEILIELRFRSERNRPIYVRKVA